MDKPKYNDAIGFVMQLEGLSREQAVDKIWRELVMDEGVKITRKPIEKPVKFDYEINTQELRDWEVGYWKDNLHIYRDMLGFFDIESLKSLERLQRTIWKSTKSNPAYAYMFGEDGVFKAYRPLDPDGDKFRGQNNGHIIEGWNQLPRSGEHLFIGSSLKDTVVTRKVGVLGCNPTSENSFRAILGKVREINARFKNVYILFDNDRAGREAAMYLAWMTGWTPVFIDNLRIFNTNKTKSAKDPSDTVEFSSSYLYLSGFFSKFVTQRYYI
jgi:hypothetical protein